MAADCGWVVGDAGQSGPEWGRWRTGSHVTRWAGLRSPAKDLLIRFWLVGFVRPLERDAFASPQTDWQSKQRDEVQAESKQGENTLRMSLWVGSLPSNNKHHQWWVGRVPFDRVLLYPHVSQYYERVCSRRSRLRAPRTSDGRPDHPPANIGLYAI